jgi:hypothetical protein
MINKKDIIFYHGINESDKNIVIDSISLIDSEEILNLNDIELINLSETRREIGFQHPTLKCKKYFVIRGLNELYNTFKVALGNQHGYDYHFELKNATLPLTTKLCYSIIYTLNNTKEV